MNTPPPPSAARPNDALDAVRREIEGLDAAVVEALLARWAEPPGQCADSATAADPSTARFPSVWRALCAAYARDVLPLLGQSPDTAPHSAGDHAALRALWLRVACGARVAEAKSQSTPELFAPAVARRDRAALRAALTHPDVEDRVVARVIAMVRQRCPDFPRPAAFDDIVRQIIIPLNKDVQLETLLGSRADGEAR